MWYNHPLDNDFHSDYAFRGGLWLGVGHWECIERLFDYILISVAFAVY